MSSFRSLEPPETKSKDYIKDIKDINRTGSVMVSRRKILSRSRDNLNLEVLAYEEEEDVWNSKEKLFKVS